MAATAYEFMSERQARLADALDRNESVSNFVQSVLEHLIDRADRQGIALADIRVETPQIIRSNGRVCVSARIR